MTPYPMTKPRAKTIAKIVRTNRTIPNCFPIAFNLVFIIIFLHTTYICSKGTTRLEARKEGGVVACTVLEDPSNQWRFVKVTEDTFHWQNVTKQAEGLQVNCEVFARRIR